MASSGSTVPLKERISAPVLQSRTHYPALSPLKSPINSPEDSWPLPSEISVPAPFNPDVLPESNHEPKPEPKPEPRSESRKSRALSAARFSVRFSSHLRRESSLTTLTGDQTPTTPRLRPERPARPPVFSWPPKLPTPTHIKPEHTPPPPSPSPTFPVHPSSYTTRLRPISVSRSVRDPVLDDAPPFVRMLKFFLLPLHILTLGLTAATIGLLTHTLSVFSRSPYPWSPEPQLAATYVLMGLCFVYFCAGITFLLLNTHRPIISRLLWRDAMMTVTGIGMVIAFAVIKTVGKKSLGVVACHSKNTTNASFNSEARMVCQEQDAAIYTASAAAIIEIIALVIRMVLSKWAKADELTEKRIDKADILDV